MKNERAPKQVRKAHPSFAFLGPLTLAWVLLFGCSRKQVAENDDGEQPASAGVGDSGNSGALGDAAQETGEEDVGTQTGGTAMLGDAASKESGAATEPEGSTPNAGGATDSSVTDASADPAEVIHEYPEQLQADEVMVDETWVYWSNGDALWRAKKDGTSETREKMGPNGMTDLGMELGQDDTAVYWVNGGELVVVSKMSLETSTLDLAGIEPVGGALLVHTKQAFVASANCSELVRVQLASGEATKWAVREAKPEGGSVTMTADEQYVYCATGGGGSIWRTNRNDGSSQEIVPKQDPDSLKSVGGLTVDENYLYWLEQRSSPFDGPLYVYRADRPSGENPTALVEVPDGTLNERLVLSDGALYWVNGPLQRLELESLTLRSLRERAGTHADIAADEKYLYWVLPGQVFRASKAALEVRLAD